MLFLVHTELYFFYSLSFYPVYIVFKVVKKIIDKNDKSVTNVKNIILILHSHFPIMPLSCFLFAFYRALSPSRCNYCLYPLKAFVRYSGAYFMYFLGSIVCIYYLISSGRSLPLFMVLLIGSYLIYYFIKLYYWFIFFSLHYLLPC